MTITVFKCIYRKTGLKLLLASVVLTNEQLAWPKESFSSFLLYFYVCYFSFLGFLAFSSDVFVDWKQNVNEVTVRLRCGEGVQRIEDVDTTFTDTHCNVSFPGKFSWILKLFQMWKHGWTCAVSIISENPPAVWLMCKHFKMFDLIQFYSLSMITFILFYFFPPDGRQWNCQLQEEIEASCSKVQYKEKGGFLHLVLHKKIPFHVWRSLKVILIRWWGDFSFHLSWIHLCFCFITGN